MPRLPPPRAPLLAQMLLLLLLLPILGKPREVGAEKVKEGEKGKAAVGVATHHAVEVAAEAVAEAESAPRMLPPPHQLPRLRVSQRPRR